MSYNLGKELQEDQDRVNRMYAANGIEEMLFEIVKQLIVIANQIDKLNCTIKLIECNLSD